MKIYYPFAFLFLLLITVPSDLCAQTYDRGVDDTVVTTVNTPVVIDVQQNDSIPNCIYTVDYGICCPGQAMPPQHGAFTILGWDSIQYIPNTGFVGTDRFRYAVHTDTLNNGACDTAMALKLSLTFGWLRIDSGMLSCP